MPSAKYEVIIWSEVDDAFIAEWLETARELRRPIPKPRGRLVFA